VIKGCEGWWIFRDAHCIEIRFGLFPKIELNSFADCESHLDFEFRDWRNRVYDGGMGELLDCAITVELPTPAGCIKPVNDVSLRG